MSDWSTLSAKAPVAANAATIAVSATNAPSGDHVAIARNLRLMPIPRAAAMRQLRRATGPSRRHISYARRAGPVLCGSANLRQLRLLRRACRRRLIDGPELAKNPPG